MKKRKRKKRCTLCVNDFNQESLHYGDNIIHKSMAFCFPQHKSMTLKVHACYNVYNTCSKSCLNTSELEIFYLIFYPMYAKIYNNIDATSVSNIIKDNSCAQKKEKVFLQQPEWSTAYNCIVVALSIESNFLLAKLVFL